MKLNQVHTLFLIQNSKILRGPLHLFFYNLVSLKSVFNKLSFEPNQTVFISKSVEILPCNYGRIKIHPFAHLSYCRSHTM
jgi:hypothetical protein